MIQNYGKAILILVTVPALLRYFINGYTAHLAGLYTIVHLDLLRIQRDHSVSISGRRLSYPRNAMSAHGQ